MNGLETFLLGRKLMKIGEEAIHRAGFHQLPTSVRSILVDVFEHPGSSVGEIAARTGFPQSHVSASVARLRQGGALLTTVDPRDRRRTLVVPSPEVLRRASQQAPAPIEEALTAALGADDPREVAEVAATLEALAQRLIPHQLTRLRTGPEPRQDGERPMTATDRPTSEPSRAEGQGRPGHPRRAEEFDALYVGTPAWDVGRPQPAFVHLAEAGAMRGRVLDVGCGTGEHALLAAGRGLAATGIDVAPTAIELAQRKAKARGLPVRFLVWDALELPSLGEQFDTVVDSGLFHLFDDADRSRYVDGLRTAIPPGGHYYLLCFSDRQPGTLGPRRVSQDEIRSSFADGWWVESIEPTTMDLTVSPTGAQASLAVITRT